MVWRVEDGTGMGRLVLQPKGSKALRKEGLGGGSPGVIDQEPWLTQEGLGATYTDHSVSLFHRDLFISFTALATIGGN